MNENIYKGKTYSFFDLLKQNRIEIPIIQRDYAQGRIDKTEIRNNFLSALYSSLKNIVPIRLDFIYGSNSNGSFQPLDGQQRLTTLFLLYWYASVKGNKLDDKIKSVLSKFSYETRITSRDFCSSLVNSSITFDPDSENISSIIIDSNWFFLSWKSDPTIDAMLRTLDDIHKMFFNIDDMWNKLVSEDSLITFYFVELENIGLTDDLYIKMNARGKLLSPFENFKAGFQKYINENLWEKDCGHIETFAFKIDGIWTDYFWKYFKKSNSIDDSLMRFISSIAMIRLAYEKFQKPEERIQTLSKLQEDPNSVRPEYFTKGGFDYLIECFDLYKRIDDQNVDLRLDFPLWRHTPRKNIIFEVVFEENTYSTLQINSASYTQKVLFFAQTEYIKKAKHFDQNKFQDWMRVIRNIVSRGDVDKDGNRPDIIRSPQTFDGVISLVNELAEGCEDIYTYISKLINLKSSFAKDQIEEEKLKARLITSDSDYKKIIFETEDNELLRGRIDFALSCIDFDYNEMKLNINKLSTIKTVFSKYFNNEAEVPNELRRALLTIEVDGEYEFYGYWWSFWTVVSASKRRLIDRFRELEYYMYCDYAEYFKKLIIELTEKSLEQIIEDFNPPSKMPNWKRRLIKEKDLWEKKGKSNYIAIPDDNSCCYLLKSKRPRDIKGCYKVE